MNGSRMLAVAAAAATALTGAVSIVGAQPQADRAVEQYTCKDLMRDGGPTREIAVAFLHGYLLGKAGGSRFNLEMLSRQTDDFVERCLDNPNEKAVDAMMAVKK
jgi:hypothetical protein